MPNNTVDIDQAFAELEEGASAAAGFAADTFIESCSADFPSDLVPEDWCQYVEAKLAPVFAGLVADLRHFVLTGSLPQKP